MVLGELPLVGQKLTLRCLDTHCWVLAIAPYWTDARAQISIKTLSIERTFVTGPSYILSAGTYVCTSQPGFFSSPGCGSEGVKDTGALGRN